MRFAPRAVASWISFADSMISDGSADSDTTCAFDWMIVNMLLTSCAMPPASCPIASIRCDARR